MMLKLILSTTSASILTYFLNINLGLGPFIASGLVGLVASKVFPKFSPAIYAASFASMSDLQVLPRLSLSGIAGLLTGILYVSAQKIFIGLGGKLGAIAFFSVLITTLFTPHLCKGAGFSSSLYFSSALAPLEKITEFVESSLTGLTFLEGLPLIFGSCLGAILTYYLSIRFHQNPVFSSGLVVLSAAVILNIFLRFDNNLMAAVTCGSYAGMSSKEIIKNLKMICWIGVVSGIILFLTWPLFFAVGGKLGLMAFLAVFLSKLIAKKG